MKTNIRILTIIILLGFMLQEKVQSQGVISIDNVTGLANDSSVAINTDIIFHIRFTNNSGSTITGSTNGFVVYSGDGAEWDTLITAFTDAFNSIYDIDPFLNPFSNDGAGRDTIGIGGFKITGSGIYPGFDQIVATIRTSVNSFQVDKHICIDSSFYPPGGAWLWSSTPDLNPEWGGPYCFLIVDMAVDVDEADKNLPAQFELRQNYPNPFNPSTKISFTLPYYTDYQLTISNLLGQEVATFEDHHQIGKIELNWNAENLSSGVYYYHLKAESFSDSKKMLLLK